MKNGVESAIEPIVVGTPLRIEVWPQQIKLDAPRREMHLVVSGFYDAEICQDLTRATSFTSSDPGVVRIDGSIARPVANGRAVITVEAGGQQLIVPVEVCGQQTVEPVSFQYGTLVALTKQGCNQGACHGSPSGKGGFRLSLRAYDPVLDTETLIREAFDRRTNRLEPEESLLLHKPLMEVPHGGGRRLVRSDANYALLRDWIAEGCRPDPTDAPQCVKVEVYPRQRILHRPAHTQQLLVLAHFSDGTLRDVTRQAVFSTSNDAVATVDGNGLVVGVERGEAAILVRYLEHMETSALTFLRDIPGFSWPNPPENNFVDHFVFEKLRQLQILAQRVVHRRRIRPPRFPGRHRHAAFDRRDAGVRRQHQSEQAQRVGRGVTGAARVCRILGAEMGRPAAPAECPHDARRGSTSSMAGSCGPSARTCLTTSSSGPC